MTAQWFTAVLLLNRLYNFTKFRTAATYFSSVFTDCGSTAQCYNASCQTSRLIFRWCPRSDPPSLSDCSSPGWVLQAGKFRQGHLSSSLRGKGLRESMIKFQHEIMKLCSQLEKLCSWIKIENKLHGRHGRSKSFVSWGLLVYVKQKRMMPYVSPEGAMWCLTNYLFYHLSQHWLGLK